MKKILALILCAAMVLGLCACGCRHEWTGADCLTPKTCAECGETEGEALGHDWADATCEAPKTCSRCALTEGEALGHDWQDATTEAPQTCATCAATEGERIITDERFTTAANQHLFGEWAGQLTMPAESLVGPGTEGDVVYDISLVFANDGTVTQYIAFADWDSVKPLFLDYLIGSIYLEYTLQGIDNDAAEEAVMNEFGMTMEELAQAYLDMMDPNSMMEPVDMVYFMEGDILNMAMSWDEEMEISTVTIEGDTLTQTYEDGETVVLTRVAE